MSEANQSSDQRIAPGFFVCVVLLAWLCVATISQICYRPPIPMAADGDAKLFSALRASAILKELVGDGIPHPSGSQQVDVVQEKIVDRLTEAGYSVHVQDVIRDIQRKRLESDPETIEISNVVAVHPGDPDLGAVMLACHYDSVPYGPGASDDGVAVAATLEIAEMVKSFANAGREIIFLFTDGEEYGLLGASAFIADNEIAKRVEFVINLEARGTSGPSLMFQTSNDNLQLVRVFSKVSPRPVTSSIFEEVYKRLPNDTDFTVFRDEADMRGFNFAFIRDARKYHTADDSFENVDLGSLQHHGENAWSLLRALSQLPESNREVAPAVYFDLFGQFVVYWRSSYSIVASAIAAILIFLMSTIAILKRETAVGELAKQVAWTFISLLGLCVLVFLLDFSFNLENRFDPPWVDHPELVAFAFWSSGLTALLFVQSLTQARSNELAVWATTWALWSVTAIFVSYFVVGASYLFLVPLTIAILVRVPSIFLSMPVWIGNGLSSVCTTAIWLPVGVLFYDGIGFSNPAVIVIRIAFVSTTLLPVLASTSTKSVSVCAWAMLGISIISIVVATIMNPAG